MTTITPEYRQQNADLHTENAHYGITGNQWAVYVGCLVADEGHASVLDYGAGKGLLARALGKAGVTVREYDPAIPGKDQSPEPADLVVFTDVAEHIEPDCLEATLSHLARLTGRKLFFDVCTSPALKSLPDGRNAHLIVQPPDWWRFKLTRHFDIVHWVERPDLNSFYGEAVPKGMAKVEAEAKQSRPKRRKLSPELSSMCGRILAISEATHDELSRIRTIRMFEGDGDRAADMQIVWDILDDVAEPAPVLERVARLANKAVMLRVGLTADRTEDFWRPLIEAHWHVIDWQPGAEGLGIVGCPRVAVAGAKVIGVVSIEDRWGQIEEALKRVTKRVELSEAHGRRAILACYGPSLRDHVDRIKAEIGEADADVVSVSGAHDFLLQSGIVPTYHVECDPRAHKADNIEMGHAAVQYLIGSVAHPALFDKLDGFNVALWHVSDTDHVPKLLRLGERGQHMITGGGSVGLRAVSLLYSMGYRDFSIYGMDCSFADDGKQQWAGKHAGKEQQVIHLTCNGRTFATSPVLATYATDFIEMVQKIDAKVRVYGDGLLQNMCVLHTQRATQAAA